MGNIALRLEGISKRYRIGGKREGYKTLRDVMSETIVSGVRSVGSLLGVHPRGAADLDETIWALQEVSLEVKRGEVVGIIGRNGAGKSTLLKILSRITEPTRGFADLYGRVSSLLEVGTGFHAELTGRENIFLNGAILGMKRVEIARKFDEIVAFAEVDRFIDTPLKHYSTGMYLRLAFAVAAHLEPDILIVDEVLAVGDANFQRKCLNKMQDVGRQGRTVLFVSHNMPAITRLCERAILLEEGRVREDGPAYQVVGTYLSQGMLTTAMREWPDLAQAPGNDVVRLRAVRVRTEDGRIVEAIDIRQPVGIEMEYEVLQGGFVLFASCDFFNEEGVLAIVALEQDPFWRRRPRPPGHYTTTVCIPGNFLSEGTLFVHCFLSTPNPHVHHVAVEDAVAFQVLDNLEGDSVRGDIPGPLGGAVRPLFQWKTQFTPKGEPVASVTTQGPTTERPWCERPPWEKG